MHSRNRRPAGPGESRESSLSALVIAEDRIERRDPIERRPGVRLAVAASVEYKTILKALPMCVSTNSNRISFPAESGFETAPAERVRPSQAQEREASMSNGHRVKSSRQGGRGVTPARPSSSLNVECRLHIDNSCLGHCPCLPPPAHYSPWSIPNVSRLSHAYCFAGAAALALGLSRACPPHGPGTIDPCGLGDEARTARPIPGTEIKFDLVPIPGGEFTMGSPADEPKRKEDEGPQHPVKIAPFWMGKCEVTWDEYDQFGFSLDLKKKKRDGVDLANQAETEKNADVVTRPTPPYADETFGFGRKGQPVICITHHAAMEYTRWLSAKTGKIYRLPTEAEWEYACRAGTKSAYSFDDPAQIGDYAWYVENAEKPQPVGKKKPNPWGLYDIHGNVAEWCLDHYVADLYKTFSPPTTGPVILPDAKEYSYVARGGSWDDDADRLRGAAQGVEPRVERPGPATAPEHLVAHRRHVRGLPDCPPVERAREPQGPEVTGGQGQDNTLSQVLVARAAVWMYW